MANFIVIVGPQAVGKMSVGQELAKKLNYKLFHNHMTIELVRMIFDYDKSVYHKMNQKLRYEILKEFSKSGPNGIIFTGCFDFGKDLEVELEQTSEWMSLFDETYVIELEASLEERLRRNRTANRLVEKASKRNLEWSDNDLIESMTKHKFNSEPGEGEKLFKNFFKINNENLKEDEVADIIIKHFGL